MRLLNIETRELEEYFDNFPAYAILSHTWGAEEITLQDLNDPDYIKKKGYVKFNGFCVLAAKLGYKYVWIDTCCIDKTNSAELSEAINSMFRWYANAPVCCAYLEDVTKGGKSQSDVQFRNSRWFTRGWTLQELIAPQRVDFYDSTWSCFGDRSSLAQAIKDITNIAVPYLCNHLTFRSANIAERMSWAANRMTTKVEDEAYSLLGIFDVNMPLLYGEGRRAFERLQLELIKWTTDESILAWGPFSSTLNTYILNNQMFSLAQIIKYECMLTESVSQDRPQSPSESFRSGPFAHIPKDFSCWIGISAAPLGKTSSVLEMTGRGLRATLPLVRLGSNIYGILNCQVGTNFQKVIAIPLTPSYNDDECTRQRQPPSLLELPWHVTRHIQYRTIYITQAEHINNIEFPLWNSDLNCGSVRLQTSEMLPEHLVEVAPRSAYNQQWNSLYPLTDSQKRWKRMLLHFSKDQASSEGFVIVLEQRSYLNAFFSLQMVPPPFICRVVRKPRNQSLVQMMENLDLSKAKNKIIVEDGFRKVTAKRDAFLKHEMFTVSISNLQTESSLQSTEAKLSAVSHSQTVGSGFANLIQQIAKYIYDSCVFSWQKFIFVPWSIATWALIDEAICVIEALTFTGLLLLFFLVRFKARLAACAIQISNRDIPDQVFDIRHQRLDIAFVFTYFQLGMLVMHRGLLRGDSNLHIILQLWAILFWPRRFKGAAVNVWLRRHWHFVGAFLIIPILARVGLQLSGLPQLLESLRRLRRLKKWM